VKAVILAGGLGTRLRPFTKVIPKPLLPIGEKALLEIQIERLKACGFDDIYVATNYKSDYIRSYFGDGAQYGVRLTISEEEKPLGTAGPLTLLAGQLDEPFVAMNGDILSTIDFRRFYRFALDKGCCLTVAIRKHITPYAFGNIFFEGDYVTDVEEKPDIVKYIIAGIYVMQPRILTFIPPDQFFGMDALLRTLLDREEPIAKYEMSDYWLDIGQVHDFEKAQAAYDTHFRTAARPPDVQ
jgi:NDP-sugar pyrophosphorylase family protein